MAKVFAQDVIEIALKHTYSGRDVVNVLHVRNDETGGDDESKVRDVLNNWQDHIVPMLQSGTAFTGADWRSLDPSEGTVGFAAPDPAKLTAGVYGGSGAPPNVAVLIKKQTSGRERGQRDGRMFLAGIAEDMLDAGGMLTGPYFTDVQTNATAFLNGVNDGGFTQGSGSGLVVLNTTPESRTKGTHEVTLTYRPVSALIVDPMCSTQRDRLR